MKAIKHQFTSALLKIKFYAKRDKFVPFRFALITLFFVGVMTDVFYLNRSYDLLLLLLVGMWVLVVRLYQFKSAITFKVVLICLLFLITLFILVPSQSSSERLTTWIYLLLIVGIVQQWRESC